MDRDKLAALIQDHCSAEEISRILLKDWRPRSDQKETEFDWGWIALSILWDRWFPEVPNFERLDSLMQTGYHEEDEPQKCDLWIKAWVEALRLKEKSGCRTLDELDARFGGTQNLFNWVQDFEMELGNAAMKEPRYHVTRVAYCEEYLRLFGGEEEGIAQGMRRAMAESIHLGGNPARADALYEEWLAVDPRWGWGWIGWSDNYSIRSGRAGKELPKAEAILKRGLAWADVRDKDDMVGRLADRLEDQDRHEEAVAVRQTIGPVCKADVSVPAQPFRRAIPKVGRNDPCPCGSGEKYKKCCGKG
jgi:hypothetical protein